MKEHTFFNEYLVLVINNIKIFPSYVKVAWWKKLLFIVLSIQQKYNFLFPSL
jgi:hypothetical protein